MRVEQRGLQKAMRGAQRGTMEEKEAACSDDAGDVFRGVVAVRGQGALPCLSTRRRR